MGPAELGPFQESLGHAHSGGFKPVCAPSVAASGHVENGSKKMNLVSIWFLDIQSPFSVCFFLFSSNIFILGLTLPGVVPEHRAGEGNPEYCGVRVVPEPKLKKKGKYFELSIF